MKLTCLSNVLSIARARLIAFAAMSAIGVTAAAQSGGLLSPASQVKGQTPQLQTRPLPGAGTVAFGKLSSQAADLLARSDIAAASWQACIHSALRQGIPLQVAITLCEIKLWQDDKRGWGDAGIASAVFRQPPPPPNAVGACASGADPTRAGQPGGPFATVGDNTLKELANAMALARAQTKDPATKDTLDKQISLIDAELDDRERTGKQVKDINITVTVGPVVLDEPKPQKAGASEGSKQPGGSQQPGGSKQLTSPEAVCAQAVAQAQEFLRECQRTAWKTAACQVFQARMNRCPDPRLAYVDPGAGYACGESPDPKLVAEAYARRCEQLARPGPDGRNPCRPQTPTGDPLVIKGVKDLCNDPLAYHTGDGCVAALVVPSAASLLGGSVQEVIVIATTRFGGPIFVLPKPAPVPRGPQPMPGPQPAPSPNPKGAAPGLLQPTPAAGR